MGAASRFGTNKESFMAVSVSDWSSLVGHTVELRRHGQMVRQGLVDAVTDDSTILWLQPDALHGRQLIMHADGYDVSVVERHD